MGKKMEKQVKKVRRTFDFQLTIEDEAKKMKDMAANAGKIGEIGMQLVTMKTELKGQIAKLESANNEILRRVRNGKEPREVDCQEVKDFEKYLVEYTFEGDVMESRPMTQEERQVEMKLVPKAEAKKAIADAKARVGRGLKSVPTQTIGGSSQFLEVMKEETSRKSKVDMSTR